jgi:hypothetical protein
VEEIRILWERKIMDRDPPDLNVFKFSKSHSRVTYQQDKQELKRVETESVLFLDSG